MFLGQPFLYRVLIVAHLVRRSHTRLVAGFLFAQVTQKMLSPESQLRSPGDGFQRLKGTAWAFLSIDPLMKTNQPEMCQSDSDPWLCVPFFPLNRRERVPPKYARRQIETHLHIHNPHMVFCRHGKRNCDHALLRAPRDDQTTSSL